MIIDTDLGADDLAALAVLIRDPGLDVRAITVARTGLVHCNPGLQNLRNLLADFAAPPMPIGCGRTGTGPEAYPFPDGWRAEADRAYGVDFEPAPATSPAGDAAVVIAGAVATSPAPPLIVALGPWTNVANAFAADPGLAGRIAGIHAMGGTLDAPGNIWAGDTPLTVPVEFNFGADPAAVAAVLVTDVPVTLVPLDATDDLPVTPSLVAALEADHAAAGANLVFQIYAGSPGQAGEGVFLWDQAAAVALLDPSVATWSETTVRAVVDRPNAGQVVRDPAGRPIRYAAAADPVRVEAALLAALRRGGPRVHPYSPVGELSVTWDGASCTSTKAPSTTGVQVLEIENDSDALVVLVIAGAQPPKTWEDLTAFAAALEPDQEVPDWVIGIAETGAEAGASRRTLVEIPAGTFGPLCLTGDFVEGGEVTIIPGEPFTIAGP
ncbi:MAG: nucleoside hydrolase [Chloroflexota bacterium]